MRSLFWETRVIDDPRLDRPLPFHRRQHHLAHLGQHPLVRPCRDTDKMQQRLMLRRRPRRSRLCGHRLHTLALARQDQPGAIVAQRANPVGVTEHARKTLHIRCKSSFACSFDLPIHVSTSRAKLESPQIVDSQGPSMRPSDSVRLTHPTKRSYSTPRKNLFDFGRPPARRPASARLPRQSASSFQLMLWSRPAESFQVRPALDSNTATSDSFALEYFCRRTPRPRAISGTWSSGTRTILWLVPITATVSPATVQIAQASFGISTLSTCLPLRVLPTQSSSLTMKPCPSWLAIRNFRPPLLTNSETIAVSGSMSMNMRIASP